MKARTLVVTGGALLALAGLAVQPAGACPATYSTVTHVQAPVGYSGNGWNYPTTRRVLVVGNGTKAPYYVTVRGLSSKSAKSCGSAARAR
jgi:hypothetical protein